MALQSVALAEWCEATQRRSVTTRSVVLHWRSKALRGGGMVLQGRAAAERGEAMICDAKAVPSVAMPRRCGA
jgi:hypothetical protein